MSSEMSYFFPLVVFEPKNDNRNARDFVSRRLRHDCLGVV